MVKRFHILETRWYVPFFFFSFFWMAACFTLLPSEARDICSLNSPVLSLMSRRCCWKYASGDFNHLQNMQLSKLLPSTCSFRKKWGETIYSFKQPGFFLLLWRHWKCFGWLLTFWKVECRLDKGNPRGRSEICAWWAAFQSSQGLWRRFCLYSRDQCSSKPTMHRLWFI